MNQCPLFFTLTNDVPCRDYVTRIVTRGRVLLSFEDDEWWCHGVDPGGITQNGETPVVAWTNFKAAMTGVFSDLAQGAESSEAFDASVRSFIYESDEVTAEQWEAARLAVRSKGPAEEELPFKGLKQVTEDIQASVTILRLEEIVPAEQEMIEIAGAA